LLDANDLMSIQTLTSLNALQVVSVTNNKIGKDNWPETAAVLEMLDKQIQQVYFVPQTPPSVYADVPGVPPGDDPDQEVLR